ncbi:MAG: isoleucine--tRNA ligase [Gemmatimonadota bacterium]
MTTYAPWPDATPDTMERELLEIWKKEGLFRQTLEQTRNGAPYVFFEGPPTANGRPGIHHVFSRTIKDLICRFHTMQGESVTRIAGWDTHGLPVEIEVEKQLGLKGKKDIETYGVERFNQLCRESVFKYKSDWEALSDRIAFWLDYDHPYITYTNNYVESVWWLLRRLHEKGLLYRGHRVLPYCPRCGTVLSSHELALGYEDIEDKSVYVAFPLEDGSGRELVVWTTTPWTLPSNVAVAVNPKLEYLTLEVLNGLLAGRKLIVARSRAHALFKVVEAGIDPGKPGPLSEARVVGQMDGQSLVGLTYRRPLNVVPLPADSTHSIVVPGDFVTAEDGSGMVHLAPAFGSDDFAAGKQHGLALVRPVGTDGTFQGTSWPELEGKLVTAKETNDLIIRRLKEDGLLLSVEQHRHSYPHCWRCRSKLIYYARDSWFVRTSAVKERMLEFNRQVGWHPPEVGAGRFGEWLENNVDWALSRDRYWGTPLPVWVCEADADHVEVVGTYDDLARHWGKPLPEGFDPHKPYIDQYTWSCSCGGTMRRATEVIDTWFDSGSMPYAQWHYPFENKEEFERHFPADYICEGVDQTRGWFYSLIAIATAAFDQPAYRNVIVNDLILDAEGQKMSKSRGNVVDPWTVLGEFGADTIRLYLVTSSQVWLPKRFDVRAIAPSTAKFSDTLRNTYEFFARYAGDWKPGQDRPALERSDQWIVDRLESTVRALSRSLTEYDVTTGTKELLRFVIDDVSNWYVRINRKRFWAVDRAADPAALYTLHRVLTTVARMLAPAAPFMSDWMHRQLAGTSVHLAGFPVAGAERDDSGLHAAMDGVRRLASMARAVRERIKLNVRQPVARARVAVPSVVHGAMFTELLEILRTEVNLKDVEVVASDTDLVRLKAKANFRSLGKRYGKDTPKAAAAAARLGPDQLRSLENGGEAKVDADGMVYVYLPDDVTVEREVTTSWAVESEGPYVVALDPELTAPLRLEGLAREMVNRVQRLRKEAGYTYTARIVLGVQGADSVVEAVTTHAAFVKEETLARELVLGSRIPAPDLEQEIDIDGHQVTVGVRLFDDGRPNSGVSDSDNGRKAK